MKRSQIYPVLALMNAHSVLNTFWKLSLYTQFSMLHTFCLSISFIQNIILFCSQLQNCVILKWFIIGYLHLFLTCLNISSALRILNQAVARLTQLFTKHLKINSSLCRPPETNTRTEKVKIME